MTKEQIQTRVKWMLNELKEHKIISNEVILDSRLFAIRSSKHVNQINFKFLSIKIINFNRFLICFGSLYVMIFIFYGSELIF